MSGIGIGASLPFLRYRKQSYTKILQNFGADEIWPLVDISSGTTIHAAINSNRDGVLSGWDLQNTPGPVPGTLAPYSDGVNDAGDIVTTNLNALFDGNEAAFFIFTKVTDSSIWSDNKFHVIFRFGASGLNRMAILKNNSNNIVFQHIGSNTSRKTQWTTTTTDWFSVGMKISGTTLKAFGNGQQVGSTQTGLGTFSGSLSPDFSAIGASDYASPASIWSGWLAYMAVWFGSGNLPFDADFASIHAAASTAAA